MKVLLKNAQKRYGKQFNELECCAAIPLRYFRGLSAGAVKHLARKCSTTTLEELLILSKEKLLHIGNRRIREEIIAVQHNAKEKAAVVHQKTLQFSEIASHLNIRIKEHEFKKLLGLALFFPLFKFNNKNDIGKILMQIMPELSESFTENARGKKLRTIAANTIPQAA